MSKEAWKNIAEGLELAGCSIDVMKMCFGLLVFIGIASLLTNC